MNFQVTPPSEWEERPPVQEGRLSNTKRPVQQPFLKKLFGDARNVHLKAGEADMVVTSPPYWMKRDYGVEGQIGQEPTADAFVESLVGCMENWKTILPVWGSVFINIGDTYYKGSLANTPGRLEIAAQNAGWTVRNRIIWVKDAGMPDPAKDRLKSRHEYIIHFSIRRRDYYYDQFGYAAKYGNGTGPSDVWQIGLRRDTSNHLAPYPTELVDRILTLACPEQVCTCCGRPRRRIVNRTGRLDPSRPQAKRAMELANEHGLTAAHIAAIQATGISDAGKAMRVQTGTGRNSADVKVLAAEAKAVLGGYFREFTFAKRETTGWTDCGCAGPFRPGIVLDPFMGTGTTLRAAIDVGRSAVGVDLAQKPDSKRPAQRGGSD
ncbi:DNA-methyltransferase [Mesorhizobium muleiense]|uniref:Methyltransferase n=1 Tax=Mesorhizobium muleiense TaxID=1004279 RepID=A0A1G9AAA3_9HYPH|nr:site-specific DNA-methyltransferase [Mesorhizobium muleiense]MCF6101772.1 site-specific DNA-methyltransferase [Mesorhizobium muleiense]SDK24201.1 DNA methylase [Mesorhizobium muleiense]